MTIRWEQEEQGHLPRPHAHLQVRTVANQDHHRFLRRYRLAVRKAQQGKHTTYGVRSYLLDGTDST